MPNNFARLAAASYALPSALAIATKAGLSLGSAYTYATAGAALGIKFTAPVSGNLIDAWFFVTASTGTPGVTTVQLRNYHTTQNTRPGTTLHATTTITPGTTANRWIHAVFGTPFSVVLGSVYWLVIGDAGWTASNTTSVASLGGMNTSRTMYIWQDHAYTSTDGFATNGTPSNAPAPFVLKFADGSLFGQPFTTNAAYASNALERGIKISGLTEKLVVSGATWLNASSLITGIKIYSGATVPGGTTDLTVTFADIGPGTNNGGCFAPFTLQRDTVYRIVLTFSGAATVPNYFEIEDDAAGADLLAAGFGGGTLMSTIDNGAGGWTDEADKFPEMFLTVQDQVGISVPLTVQGIDSLSRRAY